MSRPMDALSGYQQAIIYLAGYQACEWLVLRHIDRHYIDAVAEEGRDYKPFLQRRNDGKKPYWVLKSRALRMPGLVDVEDWQGFCRGVIELQGCVDMHVGRRSRSSPRLRIYGQQDLLTALMAVLPAKPKKIQSVRTQTGGTNAIYYQSAAEIWDILDYIDGKPRNENVWAGWMDTLRKGKNGEN